MARRVFAVLRCFSRLRDPRGSRREKKHRFLDIVALTLCAVIAGADDWPKVVAFAQQRHEWLKSFLALPNGVPSCTTVARIFELLQPQALQRCFLRWLEQAIDGEEDKHLAIDGKTLRGSGKGRNAEYPLHMVSVWATRSGLCLGQQAVAKKSNEITAVPVLLKLIDVSDAWVTLDAMGCQREIAAAIIAGGGRYVLTVKGNQGLLLQDLTAAFAEADATGFAGLTWSQYVTEEQGHGRHEKRSYTVICQTDGIRNQDAWAQWTVLGRCVSERTVKGETTREVRYFIGSKEAEAKVYGALLRNHWRIENCLHWQLDVTFREDNSHIHKQNAAENYSLLRRLALCLLKRHPAKESIATKRYRATLSVAFLEEVLESGL